jgi:hypothetical protein
VGQAVYPLRTLRMPKVLCLAGMVIAILILVLFLLDLALKFPFQRINTLMDVVFVICAVALGYVSWSTLREQD